MNKLWLIRFLLILLVIIMPLSGCTSNDIVPLPGSAKHSGPSGIAIPVNQITIPFPYTDISPNGTEQWALGIDTSGKTVLRVWWKNREIAAFHVNSVGINQVTGEITLGEKEYIVISITLNSDNKSGWITLEENS